MNIYEALFKGKKEARNIVSYYHKNGVWRTVLHWLVRIGMLSIKIFFKKEYLTFLELNLVNPAYKDTDDKTIAIVRAGREDIEKDYYDGSQDRDLAITRLERGDVLITVRDNGMIIFSQWLVFNKVHIPAIHLFFDIPETTVYLSNMYTVPENRGKRVASSAVPHLLKHLKDLGYQKVFTLVDPENKPSIRVNSKAGFMKYQTCVYLRFMLFIKFYIVKDCASHAKKVCWSIRKTDQQIWKTFSKITLNK